ncbi:MAG: cobalt ECF transporter T component CbiQ [Xenococcaceae cyanobacterium]
MLLLHLGAFNLDADSKRKTPWHKLTPQTRLLCVLLIIIASALTPNGHWLTWIIYGIGILILLLVSRITLSILLKRLAIEFAFIGVLLIGTLFRDGTEVVWQWGWLKLTSEGITIALSVTSKALISLLLLNLLTLTTSIPSLLQALTVLKMPPILVSILASMYRYIGVSIEEADSMRRAAISRNLTSNKRWQRLVVANAIGSLFIRTYDRGERVHRAMLARGYQGLPPVREMSKGGKRDMVALTLTALLALLGQAVYL